MSLDPKQLELFKEKELVTANKLNRIIQNVAIALEDSAKVITSPTPPDKTKDGMVWVEELEEATIVEQEVYMMMGDDIPQQEQPLNLMMFGMEIPAHTVTIGEELFEIRAPIEVQGNEVSPPVVIPQVVGNDVPVVPKGAVYITGPDVPITKTIWVKKEDK